MSIGSDWTGSTPDAARRAGVHGAVRRLAGLGVAALSACALFALTAPAGAFAALPDGRAYEMVTPLDKNGIEVGAAIASTSGNAANWEAIGGCCGATSAASTLYQSTRTSTGWQTVAETPAPPAPLEGLFAEQQPMWWSLDLSKTIYLTSACSGAASPSASDFCAAGDQRPQSPSASPYNDLYEQAADGTMTWLTQGPFPGAGTNPDSATWAATTPDGNSTLFDTVEQLTPDATGLASLNTPPEFLYDRNIANGTTSLIDVTTTNITAPASGPASTTLTAGAVGTTPTTLTALASPAANDSLTANATGPQSTTLTQPATGNVSTTLTAGTLVGATDLPVVTSAGFAIGQTITVGAGTSTEETTRVTGIPDGTDITVDALTGTHSAGDSVTYGGDTTIAVGSTTGFAPNQVITIAGGGLSEPATIASVNSTQINLTMGLTNSYPTGATVSYQGDTSITVNDTSNLQTGETITIDTGTPQENAVIAGITGNQVQLTAPLANDHSSGAPVTYVGDSTLAVGSSANFSAGQTITIDPGQPNQETSTIASIPDGTDITLTATVSNPHASGATVQHASPDSSITVGSTTGFSVGQTITIGGASPETGTISSISGNTITLSAPLTNNHSSGDPVSYGGDTTITVASTSAFAAGQSATIGSGASQEADTIASVPDSTHLVLSTPLVNNHATGDEVEALISPDGAIAGNGNWLDDGFLPADYFGTTTNSISSDGTKVFFESPPTFEGGGGGAEGVGPAHLYMRDLATDTTTQLDANPTASGEAVYEGASQNGALVFFTSSEGLGGDSNSDNELYEFNTTGSQIGPAPAMSVIPISDGGDPSTAGNVEGITAISNDGSHVYFVAEGVLASNTGADGTTATTGNQNFYVFNTATGATTFIATLGTGIPDDTRDKTLLAGEPDTSRAAIPTPDGSVLVFLSTANLTNENPSGPTTTLTAATSSAFDEQAVDIPVASSAGFVVGRSVEIETNPSEGYLFSESATITGIPDSTDLLVNDSGIGLFYPHNSGDSVVQRPPTEAYRYSAADNSLVCISCTPNNVTSTHVTPTAGIGLGASGGGTYGPATDGVPMSSDGSRIFFTSADPLTPGVISSPPIPIGLFGELTFVSNVYEWEADGTGSCSSAGGCVYLISDGQSTTGSSLGSTTPSGNDVFIETEDQLVPQDTDGYDDIYDARVGGGFPAPPTSAAPCESNEACRSSVAPTVFFPVPTSATQTEPTGVSPSFSVNAISAAQRRRLASTGVLTLTVHVTQAGKIAAVASDLSKRVRLTVATASHSFFATDGGTAKLTLRLSKAARNKLAKQHRLSLTISVSYSESSEVYIASLTLTKARGKPAGDRRSTVRHGTRER
jgi:hypothetical protein